MAPSSISAPNSPSIPSPLGRSNLVLEEENESSIDRFKSVPNNSSENFNIQSREEVPMFRDRVISCNDVVRSRREGYYGLSGRSKILMKNNLKNKSNLRISCENEKFTVNEILSNYSQKLRNNCFNNKSFGFAAYGNGTETFREIPLEPERILDAPGIVDDFYLNCLSWSVQDILAIGLAGSVYLWNARSGQVTEL